METLTVLPTATPISSKETKPKLVDSPIRLIPMNREGWLTLLAQLLQVKTGFGELLKGRQFKVSCGFPCRRALLRRYRRQAECHYITNPDGTYRYELFITPLISDSLYVGGLLCHEMAHVACDDAKHNSEYKEKCEYVGLTKGPLTSVMPGEWLTTKLMEIIEEIGHYPHIAISSKTSEAAKRNRKTDRRKLKCSGCGCSVSISVKLLAECGATTCACGQKMKQPHGV